MKVVFLTGTRADYGKIKPLINILSNNKGFDVSMRNLEKRQYQLAVMEGVIK